ncbi:MAG: hypothetical protein ACW98Y_04765 [Candidatus Thorarchaeota archaeon]|jgi:hypothetical protein
MLKEVFVIEEGILQYHFNADKGTDDSDDAVLSSGLLTAIRDFSQHARSDVLDSFSTETEYFLFTAVPSSRRIIVGVFDRRTPMQVARDFLLRMIEVVEAAHLPSGTGEMPSSEKKLEIRQKIERIATQLFGRDALAQYIEEILEGRNDIPLAFLVDFYDKTLLAHFARPRPLFKEQQVQEFLLLHSTLLTSLPKLGIEGEYESFLIESQDYVVSGCRGGRLLSVASGAMKTPAENVESASYQMCYDLQAESPDYDSEVAQTISKGRILSDGSEKHEDGQPLPPTSRIFVSTLVNNIDSFFGAINRRKFSRFEVRSGKDPSKALVLKRSDSETGIEILQF